MPSISTSFVFIDFNDSREEPPLPAVADTSCIDDEIIGQAREEAWTDGYLTGRQEPRSESADAGLAARLVTSLHELDGKTAQVIDAASLVVAELLVNTVIATASDDWKSNLLSRIHTVAGRVKPALTIQPEFVLCNDRGIERCFADVSSLSRALDDGIVGDDVTIRWQRGEATISRMALLEDLREAVIPLSDGLINDHTTGVPS